MSLDRPSMFRHLNRLDFGEGSWAVAGSGPMLAHGIVPSISDIDIVADGRAWQQALELTSTGEIKGLRGDRIIRLLLDGVSVEVFDGWLGLPAVGVIERADVVEGYRFMSLGEVTSFKRLLDRPKDRVHVVLIEQHLADGHSPTAD